MLESRTFFTNMVDELVEFSEHDPELSDGIKWLDGQAQKRASHFMTWFLKYYTSMMLIQKRKIGLILEINTCFIF